MSHKGPLPSLPLFITSEQAEGVRGGKPHGPASSVLFDVTRPVVGALGIPLVGVSSVRVWSDRVEVVRYRRDNLGRGIPVGNRLATETTVIAVIPSEVIAADTRRLAAMGA